MQESVGAMQDRLASHYLMDANSAGRLRSTLTLAARTLGFPMAMINILDSDSQHTISAIGTALGTPHPRDETFCDSVVRTNAPVVVRDAAVTQEFAGLPCPQWRDRRYVGVPLSSRESAIVGSICMLDSTSRSVTTEQVTSLVEFGKIVEDQLDLIRRLADQRDVRPSRTEELAAAIPAGEIEAWYQPVIDLRSGRTASYEALARWRHPSGLVEAPTYFVPLAEDSDLIIELDRSILRQALRDLHRWQRSHWDARVSVNLSARHFERDGWASGLRQMAEDVGVAPQSVYLELTETSRLSAGPPVDALVAQLRAQGFGLLLDDFGTGWSSLEYLLRMPVHGLKIDRVVSAALGSPVGDAMIRVVTGLARELGLTTTIEGIETAQQAEAARRLGCDLAQGYLVRRRPGRDGGIDDRPVLGGTAGARAVTEQQTFEYESSIEAGLAGAVLDSLPDVTAVLDEHGVIVAVSRSWRLVALGGDGKDGSGAEDGATGVGVNYLEVCDRSAAAGCIEAAIAADHIRAVLCGDLADAETEYPCSTEAPWRWFIMRVAPLLGRPGGAIVSHVDITRRKAAEDQLAHAASHDALTGLPNRMLFHRRLAESLDLGLGRLGPTTVGVLYIDLDGFKAVNDTFGHYAGDEVLLATAQRLRESIRPSDTVSRLGGDEFAILVPDVDHHATSLLAEQLRAALSNPHHIDGHEVRIVGSVGCHVATVGDDPTQALHHADRDMYAAKFAQTAE